MKAWPFIAGGSVLALAGVAAARGRGPSTPSADGPKGRTAIVELAQGVDLGGFWTTWLVWVAKGESGYNSNVQLGEGTSELDVNERKASQVSLDRQVKTKRWPCSSVDPAVYAIGSGGWYGQLAPLTVVYLAEHRAPIALACNPLAAWHDPVASTLAHLVQARGVAKQLPIGYRTALDLRAGYGLPKRLKDPETLDTPERRAKYSKTLQGAGIPVSFLDEIVPAASTLNAAIAQLEARVSA